MIRDDNKFKYFFNIKLENVEESDGVNMIYFFLI